MKGIEAELVYQVSQPLKVTFFGDYIHTKVVATDSHEEDKLPRIPPLRVGLQLNYQGAAFDSEFSANHYFDQNQTNSLETSTDGYTMLNAHANYYLDRVIDGLDSDLVMFLKIENITDVNAQVHSSFLKEVAPLPGRGFSLGIRGSF
jgi:iron complex outermembrane receptor protein